MILKFEFMELEQHPTNPNILYTVQLLELNEIHRSTDGGMTFSA